MEYSAPTIELTAAVVCETCNNGWMSRLETAAQPLLVSMIQGAESVILDAENQRTVTAWATKTAMVFEHTLSLPTADIYWSAEERAAFRSPPHTPPGRNTVVRIAAHAGSHLVFGRAGAQVAAREPATKGTRATLAIGKVVLQVESDRWQEATGRVAVRWPPMFSLQSEQIWPVVHAEVRWPTGAPLDDASLGAFAQG